MDVNEANVEELARIVGIGDECAGRIIRFRAEHGWFMTSKSSPAN